MNLLEIASKNGRTYKQHGDEYHGPCPSCGGTDRFHVWPEQGDYGTFWCRGCTLAGDAIEYLMKIEGFTFPQACRELGKELPEMEEYQAPHFKRTAAASETFTPRETTSASDLWIQHATKLVDWSHQQLLGNPDQLAWLAGRGIDFEAVTRYRLGWNSGENGNDLYRAREAWGLDTVLKPDGKTKKKLWLPLGLVIPCYEGCTLARIRIRIPNDRRTGTKSLPYYLVPGSSTVTFVTVPYAKAWIITEAELDAIAVAAAAGDLVGAMAMGNSTSGPTEYACDQLQDALWIGNALDYDPKINEQGVYENAGGTGGLRWLKHFPQAERWPVPVGKDPGDAFKAGINLREWVKSGLPPALILPPPPKRTAKPASAPASQDVNLGAVIPAAPPESETAPIVVTRTAQDGRTFHITNDQNEYSRLVAIGEIVFDFDEIQLAIKSGATPTEAACFLSAKQAFPGIRLTEVQLCPKQPETLK